MVCIYVRPSTGGNFPFPVAPMKRLVAHNHSAWAVGKEARLRFQLRQKSCRSWSTVSNTAQHRWASMYELQDDLGGGAG